MVFLFIIIILIIGLVTSKLEIKILNLKYTRSDNSNGNSLEYLTKIKIYLFGIINMLFGTDTNIIKAVNFKANIGAKSVILTSTIIAFLSTLISILFSKIDVSPQFARYKITPNYNVDEKLYKVNIFLNCAFELKMYHVINVFLLQNS